MTRLSAQGPATPDSNPDIYPKPWSPSCQHYIQCTRMPYTFSAQNACTQALGIPNPGRDMRSEPVGIGVGTGVVFSRPPPFSPCTHTLTQIRSAYQRATPSRNSRNASVHSRSAASGIGARRATDDNKIASTAKPAGMRARTAAVCVFV